MDSRQLRLFDDLPEPQVIKRETIGITTVVESVEIILEGLATVGDVRKWIQEVDKHGVKDSKSFDEAFLSIHIVTSTRGVE